MPPLRLAQYLLGGDKKRAIEEGDDIKCHVALFDITPSQLEFSNTFLGAWTVEKEKYYPDFTKGDFLIVEPKRKPCYLGETGIWYLSQPSPKIYIVEVYQVNKTMSLKSQNSQCEVVDKKPWKDGWGQEEVIEHLFQGPKGILHPDVEEFATVDGFQLQSLCKNVVEEYPGQIKAQKIVKGWAK